MAFIIKGDLYSLIYEEIIETITRGDETVIDRAIATGISEAKSYLSRYDTLALFGAGEVDKTIDDENLKSKVIDLVCWQLIKLCNPNIDLKLFRTNYEDAINFFEQVKVTKIAPEGWIYKADDPETPFPEGSIISIGGNIKRNNHW